LKTSIEVCTNDKETFEKDDKERLRELEILKTLIDYFTANVGSLEEYLKIRKTEWLKDILKISIRNWKLFFSFIFFYISFF